VAGDSVGAEGPQGGPATTGDGTGPRAAPGRPPRLPPIAPKRPGRRRVAIGIVVLVGVIFTLYVLSQVPAISHSYSLSVTTSCICPTSARDGGAARTVTVDGTEFVLRDSGVGWLDVPALSTVSGTWSVSNDTDVDVIFEYGPENYTNASGTSGSFQFSGPPSFDWVPGAEDWGAVSFDVLAPYPVNLTIVGTYTSPAL
jgi:hypothetical protein